MENTGEKQTQNMKEKVRFSYSGTGFPIGIFEISLCNVILSWLCLVNLY